MTSPRTRTGPETTPSESVVRNATTGRKSAAWLIAGLLLAIAAMALCIHGEEKHLANRATTVESPPARSHASPAPRPQPFKNAVAMDYDVREYMYAIAEMESSSPSLTSQQAEEMLQLFLGTYPDYRESKILFARSAEILTERQKAFLALERKLYNPPTSQERRQFFEHLKDTVGVAEVAQVSLPPSIVRERKSAPYLDLVVVHFDRMQGDERLRLNSSQIRRLLPLYRYFIDHDICPTLETALAKILTDEQERSVARIMVELPPPRPGAPHLTPDVEQRFLALLKSRV